jgi:hypothetical protein
VRNGVHAMIRRVHLSTPKACVFLRHLRAKERRKPGAGCEGSHMRGEHEQREVVVTELHANVYVRAGQQRIHHRRVAVVRCQRHRRPLVDRQAVRRAAGVQQRPHLRCTREGEGPTTSEDR